MIILDIILVVCIAVLSAGVISLWEKIREDKSKGMSFKESLDLTELPVVTFRIGNGKLNFLLDTGSNVSHINKSVLPKIPHIKTDSKNEVFGMEGNPVLVDIVKIKLQYDGNEYVDDFNVTDLNAAFTNIKEENGVTIHGILGSNFFEKYNYVLDFNKLIAYSINGKNN